GLAGHSLGTAWHRAEHGLQVGSLGLDAGGRAAARNVLAGRRADQVAHAAGRGPQHLLVLVVVGGAAQVRQQVQVALRGLLLELLAQARLLLAAQPLGVGLLVGRERLLRLVALVALCAQRVVGPTRPLLGCCRRVVLVVLKPVLLLLGRQVVEAAAVHRAAL